jgi:hypothetical protein
MLGEKWIVSRPRSVLIERNDSRRASVNGEALQPGGACLVESMDGGGEKVLNAMVADEAGHQDGGGRRRS